MWGVGCGLLCRCVQGGRVCAGCRVKGAGCVWACVRVCVRVHGSGKTAVPQQAQGWPPVLGAPLGLVATCRRSQGWACHCLVRNPHQQPAATAHVQQCPAFKRPRGVRRDPEMVLNAGPDKADPRLAATRGGNRGRAAQGMGQRVNAPWVPPSWSRRKRSVRPVSSGGCVPGGNSQQGAPSHAHPAPRAGGQRRVRPALACATTACLRGGANGGRGGGRPPRTGPAGGGGPEGGARWG